MCKDQWWTGSPWILSLYNWAALCRCQVPVTVCCVMYHKVLRQFYSFDFCCSPPRLLLSLFCTGAFNFSLPFSQTSPLKRHCCTSQLVEVSFVSHTSCSSSPGRRRPWHWPTGRATRHPPSQLHVDTSICTSSSTRKYHTCLVSPENMSDVQCSSFQNYVLCTYCCRGFKFSDKQEFVTFRNVDFSWLIVINKQLRCN